MLGSCRVCGINLEDGECESFLTLVESDKKTPSEAGYLYEELMGLRVLADNIDNTAIFLCYSCDLQMKLFKKLKEKALRTMLAMQECFQKKFNEPNDEFTEKTAYSGIYPTFSNMFKEKSSNEYLLDYLEGEELEEEKYVKTELVDLEGQEFEANEEAVDEENSFTDMEMLEEGLEDVSSDDNDVENNDENNGFPEQAAETTKKGFDCICCHQHFDKRNDYKLHRIEVHGNKYPCPECANICSTADALRVHLKLHNTARKYKCELCGRTFNQKVHLNYHLNRHNNVRSFSCEACDKAFLSKSDLNIHMRTHTGEKPFCCSICSKKFLIFQHLKTHLYSHNTEKEFECDICKFKFISPVTLKVHQQNMHSELKYECEFCARKFRLKKYLKNHYKVHEKYGPICEEEVTEQLYEQHTRAQEESLDGIIVVEGEQEMPIKEVLFLGEEEDSELVDDFFVV